MKDNLLRILLFSSSQLFAQTVVDDEEEIYDNQDSLDLVNPYYKFNYNILYYINNLIFF